MFAALYTIPNLKQGVMQLLRQSTENSFQLLNYTSLIVFIMVFFSIDPLFPLNFLVNSWVPGMFDSVFQASFLCGLLLFWLCAFHGIRQVFKIFFLLSVWKRWFFFCRKFWCYFQWVIIRYSFWEKSSSFMVPFLS